MAPSWGSQAAVKKIVDLSLAFDLISEVHIITLKMNMCITQDG